MTSLERESFRKELLARGFNEALVAPNETMWFEDGFLDGISVADLFDRLVSRREKIFRSSDIVGVENSKKAYGDVILAIDALKAIISRMAMAPRTDEPTL